MNLHTREEPRIGEHEQCSTLDGAPLRGVILHLICKVRLANAHIVHAKVRGPVGWIIQETNHILLGFDFSFIQRWWHPNVLPTCRIHEQFQYISSVFIYSP